MAPSGKSAPDRAGDKDKALEAALLQIERQFGKGSIMRLGEETRVPVEVIPTGSIALDVALGIGGYPRGRIVEIYGPESSGKTTIALHAVANAQKGGGIAAFIDAEHALDPEYAQKLGVDTEALLVSQPDTGEQALEIMDMLIRSGAIDIVVVDSVAALVPKAEIEGEMGDSHVGLQARLMSQALRKITGAVSNTKTTAIFINQLREKVGVMFGSPETTTGGKALKFYASVRLDIRRIETLKDGTDAVGNRTRVKVVKNKMAPPFKTAEMDILYGIGVSREGGLIDLGVEQGIVRKSGAWYTYEGDQLGQGKENARNYLKDNPDRAEEIEKRIKEKLGVGPRLDNDATVPARAPGARGGWKAAETLWRESDPAPKAIAGRRARGRSVAEDPEARARQVCLTLLTFAPRTRAQLAVALRKRGIPDEVADEVLARFEDVGLIDDAAFARSWVESRHYSRGLAGRALSAELKQRGVAADEIRAALDEQLSPDAEAAAARRLVERRIPGTRGLPADQRTRRLAGMLARKGYPPGLAYRVIKEALEAEGESAALEDEPSFDFEDSDTE